MAYIKGSPLDHGVRRQSHFLRRGESGSCSDNDLAFVVLPQTSPKGGESFMGHLVLCPSFWNLPNRDDAPLRPKDFIGAYRYQSTVVSSPLPCNYWRSR